MKILIFNWMDITHPLSGGAEVVTHEIAKRFVLEGNVVTLFTSRFKDSKEEETIDGIKIYRAGNKYTVYWKARKFYHKYFKGKYDVIIDEINTVPFFTPRFAKNGERIFVLIHQLAREFWFSETKFPFNYLGYYLLENWWLKQYRNIPTLTVSNSTKNDLEQLGFRNVSIFPEGINFKPLEIAPEKEKEPTLIFVGRLKSSKKPLDAIQAYKQVKKKIPNVKLWVVGSGYMKNTLQEFADEGVTFWGHLQLEKKNELMRRAHLILVPGIREGWGLVVTEANGFGTPAVAYNVHGLRDSTIDNYNGILCKGNTPANMAENVIKLLADRDLYNNLQTNALVWARKFSWEKSFQGFKSCIHRIPHVFTAELPYETDQVITLFLRDRFSRVDSFVMSLGQMSRIPPSKLYSYVDGNLIGQRIFKGNKMQGRGKKLYFFIIPAALVKVTIDLLKALKSIHFTCDIFFAQHFLPAFVAIILRRIGILRCHKIIFFMFDFFLIPPEFPRSLYYRGIDSMQRYIRKHVDEIWYTTPRLVECDTYRYGLLPEKVTKRVTECYFFRKINVPEPPPVPPLRLAFLGSLRSNNAVYETIDSISYSHKMGMNVELLIIGSGSEEERLKRYAEKKRLGDAIKFYGFEDRGEEIARIFSTCHLGIALYNSEPYSVNWFLTSGKFRRFVSQRLPVIISSVPYAAKYIQEYNAGFVVDNSVEDFYRVLKLVYDDSSLLSTLRQGIDKLYEKFNADIVLDKAFSEMLTHSNNKRYDVL